MKTQAGSRRRRTRSWLPVALIALVIIPGAGGIARLVELAGGAGWVINLAIAERAIRRRPGRRATPALVEIAIS